MKSLFAAIYSKFIADGKYGLVTLYHTEAKSNAVFPYGVFSLVSNPPGEGEFGVNWEEYFFQFALYSETPLPSEVEDVATALSAAFDHYDLAVTGSETISLERVNTTLVRMESKVWQHILTYRLLLERI